jgi:UDP-glucose 4-epimerase
MIKKPKILVTGGTGYIGSHTVVELQKRGYEVIIFDNLSNSSIEVLEWIEKITKLRPEFYKVDISDRIAFNDVFSTIGKIDAVIHFAALKAVGESIEKPLEYYNNNIVSLLNLLGIQKKFNIRNLVFSSSCTVYGQPEKLPVTEDSPIIKSLSPYGNTKKISEEIIEDFSKVSKNFNSILLRYFNPVGAHDSALIGEIPNGIPNNLVPFVTQTAIGIRDELKVFGYDYNTPDGSAIRDFIHVVDLAKAHVVAIERLLDSKNPENLEVFNLGTGKGYSVLELVNTFEKVTGQKLKYKIVERREGDIEKVYADTTKANKILAWKAELDIEEMLLSAWKWEDYYRREITKEI